ncbi:hypothetical protein Moror_7975 [Moniliophthora roreri MCA 2997]|uniref:F-box domain-containing protein n=2 Tax=Moniliophthora roreri TaxID=221103 RepID=V2X5T4_MONRO|nr:hypothetical protein Moror_7975 [Moniliophthora roreri MCA 2997]KAI3610542.1 hypothetical protein WG66_006895 [Moniliophthora roreri]
MTALFRKLRTALQNPTTSVSPLPLDIVDVILEELRHEKIALDSCSLVCRAWTHYSRPHRFSETIIVHRAKLVKLLRLLDSPHCTLRPYLRSMTVDQTERGRCAWIESFFALIRRKDIALRELTIPSFTTGLNVAFLRSGIVPLRSLHLNVKGCSVEETMQFVCLFCDTLESLALRGCSTIGPSTYSQSEWRRAYPSCHFPHLRKFHIEGVQWMTGYMEWFRQFAALEVLSSLYLSFGYFDDPCRIGDGISHTDVDFYVASFLANACGAVEILTLDYDWSSPISRLDLSTLPRLYRLSVIWHGRASADVATLATLMSSARMSALSGIHLSNFDFEGGLKKASIATAWSRLDAALSRTHPALFPCLRNVEVSPARLLALLPGCRRTVNVRSGRTSRKIAWSFPWKQVAWIAPYEGA